MPEWFRIAYTCYLGKEKGTRLFSILELVKNHCGELFFEKYSTSKDTILDFIKRCRNAGVDLK